MRIMAVRSLCVAALLAETNGYRARRPGKAAGKTIAGVPVLNYHRAYAGVAHSSENIEQDWIIVADDSSSDQDLKKLCSHFKLCKSVGHPSEGGVPFLSVKGSELDLASGLGRNAGVAKFIETDTYQKLIPEDDEFEAEASLHQTRAEPWSLTRVGKATRTGTGKGVSVYVGDGGIRTTHGDFDGRAVPAIDATSGSVVKCSATDRECAKDVRGHGTHCAGTVGGNAYGLATDSTIYAVKLLDDSGAAPWSTIILAIDWISTNARKPAIASLSLGGPGVEYSVETATEVAVNRGITVVVASGNNGKDACEYTPAFSPHVITVGASNGADKVAYFSNWGPCGDIWAPGTAILSAGVDSDSGSKEKSGTSMACPLVAGAAALVLEQSPSLKPSAVLQSLLDKALPAIKSKDGDTNLLLYVGDADATPPPSAPSRRRAGWR